jgi:uncharacterized protein (DUF1778 family)
MRMRYTSVPRRPWSLRLRDTERQLLRLAAAQLGESLSEYIRRTALAAARRDIAPGASS